MNGPAPRLSSAPTLALVAAVLLGSGAAGFGAYRLLSPGSSSLTAIAPERTQPGAAGQPSRVAPRKIPDRLPDLPLADSTGKLHRLSDWKGHLLVVNFWATWCEPCQREIPLLERLRAQRAAEGFEVVGVAVDVRSDVLKYMRAARIDYPVLIGDRNGLALIAALGMDTVFPFTVFADRDGRIITVKVGEMHPEQAKLIFDRIHDLDQGRLDLRSAREQIASGIAALSAARARADLSR